MRKEFGKALRKIFAERMKERLPQFTERSVKSIYLGQGHRAYGWNLSEKVIGWVVLSPSAKDYDEFTILIGWSRLGRYPELSMIPCFELPSPAHDEFKNEEYLARLPFLWGKQDTWWVIRPFTIAKTTAELQAWIAPISDEAAEKQVRPLVAEAIEKLVEFGLPYLEEFKSIFTHSTSDI